MSKNKINRPDISQGKRVKVNPLTDGSTNHLKPNFSFEHLVGSHSVEACEQEDRASLAVQLCKIGSLTWGDIQRAPKYGLGHEKISHDSIKASIPDVVTPDTALLSFRFNGKKPMVGFRSGQTFFVLFLDRDFSLYNHG